MNILYNRKSDSCQSNDSIEKTKSTSSKSTIFIKLPNQNNRICPTNSTTCRDVLYSYSRSMASLFKEHKMEQYSTYCYSSYSGPFLSFMIESRYDHLNSSCDKGSKSANNCQNHYISTLVYLMNIYLILSPCYIGSIMDSKKREQQISNVFSFYKQLLDIPIKVYSTSLLCLFLSLSLSNDASTYENDLYAIYIQLFPSNESKPSTIENMKSFRDKLIIVYLVVYDLKSNRVIRSIRRFILMIGRKRRAWFLLCSKRNTTVLIMMYFLYVLLCIPNEWSYRDILQSTSTLSFILSNHAILLIENKIVFVLFL